MKKSVVITALITLLVCMTLFLFGCVAPAVPPEGGGNASPPATGAPETGSPEEEGGQGEENDGQPPLSEPDFPNEPEQPTQPGDPPPPAKDRDTLVVSSVDGLAVRSGRGASYRKLGEIDRGDMLEYTALSGGWYQVLYRNGYGYVSAAYLTTRSFFQADEQVEAVIDEGEKLMGTPYVFGAQRYHWGNGVRNSAFNVNEFDCSSLMQYIFKKGANVNLDTTTRSQSVQGEYVSKSNLARGDLMFFTNDSRYNNSGLDRIGHVAMYLGDNYILHTASDYAVIEEISAKRWSYYITARRFFD